MSHSFARTLHRAGAHRVLTDRALADLAAEGDARAADVLVSRHETEMCRLVAGVVGEGPTASGVASAALATARADVAAGLPADRAPRLALLAAASTCAAGAGTPAGETPPAEMAHLPTAERTALVLTATIGLGVAAAASVLGTTPDHVSALVASAEADLTAYPAVNPQCLDARAEIPAAGALTRHASACPSCAAFAVERAERGRRLAAVAAVAPAAVGTGTAVGAAGVAVATRQLPRVELAVLGTVGLVVATVGVTLGVVLTTSPSQEVPEVSADDLRPRTVPAFPEVAEAEQVRFVAPIAASPPAAPAASRRARFGIAPLVEIGSPGVAPASPQPPPPSTAGSPSPGVDSPAPGAGRPDRLSEPDVAVVLPPAPAPPARGEPVSGRPRPVRDDPPPRRKKIPPPAAPVRAAVVTPPAPPAPVVVPPPPPAAPPASPSPSPPAPPARPDRDDDHGDRDDGDDDYGHRYRRDNDDDHGDRHDGDDD